VITFWGEGARLIKWWTKEQAEGAHLRLLYPPGGSEDGAAENHLRQAAERGEYTGEGQRVRSDYSTFWAGITLTALYDADGTLLGFAKVTRDLTARRAADALLQTAAEAAESARAHAVAASAAKSGFLATMSHEIRTPINAVMGYMDLLDIETDGPLNAAQHALLARARASARHLLALISEVLDFSRIEANRVRVGRAAFRLGDVVTAALGIVTPDALVRGVEVSDDVSGYAAGLSAWGDEDRVRQILVNLLANAIKFTNSRNGHPGCVKISAGTATQASPDAQLEGPGPWVYLRVEDTGTGIAADRMEPIFEPFVQVDMTLTRAHGGTGLGLAISRRLARLMDGDVTARSELGVGSTFFLWLPAAPVESLETGGLEGHGPGGEGRAPRPLKVGEEAPALADSEAHARAFRIEGAGAMRGLADMLMAELERVLHAYVARVRTDPETPSAHQLAEPLVENHLASFLADVAGTLQHLDVAARSPSTDTVSEVDDGSAIQRVVAERHGAHRARLGWGEDEVRREFAILREELSAALQRSATSFLPGPTDEAREGEGERAMEVLTQFLGVAERLSIGSYRRTIAAERKEGESA
jgi:signal transduction histidine kinase